MIPYYEDDHCRLYQGDCREILPSLGRVDLVLTDPQWGADTRVDNTRFSSGVDFPRGKRIRGQDCHFLQERKAVYGDAEPFDPSPLLSLAPKLILWGNYNYSSRLPDTAGALVWDKRRGIEEVDWPLSDSEIAWTNICKGVHTFRNRWFGLVRSSERGEHFHPTQKPIALMRWCIEQAGTPVLILDPYMGVGSTILAARELGCYAIGIEIDEEYCTRVAERLRQQVFSFPAQNGQAKDGQVSTKERQLTLVFPGEA